MTEFERLFTLLDILHPADRASLSEAQRYEWAAHIIAEHEGDDLSELFSFAGDAEDLSAQLWDYINFTRDPQGLEIGRDTSQITGCERCVEHWRNQPRLRRSRAARQQAGVYRACTRTGRRTKADIEGIKNKIYDVVAGNYPMSLRQVFYALVVRGVVAKTEAEYDHTVGRLLLAMRRAGEIPYGWIADNTRCIRKPPIYDSVQAALKDCRETYRKAVWRALDAQVQVWIEKAALATVLEYETADYDVGLAVARGFCSETFLYEAAQALAANGRSAWVYYLGDHDPSGHAIAREVERKLRGFAPGLEIHFEWVAVTADQINDLNLPTRPTKREGNSHAKGFVGDSVS
jgi:hypothetical protein